MLSKLRQMFRRIQSMFVPKQLDDIQDGPYLGPPADPLDIAGWDQYWLRHIEYGFGPSLMDMFCDDSILIEVMRDQGMKSILCAGSGISQEPKALAAAGMEVVALDISPQAVEIARSYRFPMEAVSNYYEAGLQRPGGRVEFVTGDFLDSTVCPGPFDVVIERRTAQNYFTHDLGAVLSVLANRLSKDGIFFSHCHDGAWKPPDRPRHYSEAWFRDSAWTIWNGSGRKPPGRVAWLLRSTG
jgi:Methyltransferase domain